MDLHQSVQAIHLVVLACGYVLRASVGHAENSACIGASYSARAIDTCITNILYSGLEANDATFRKPR